MMLLAVEWWEQVASAIAYVLVALVVARLVDWFLGRRDEAVQRLLKRPPSATDRTRYQMVRRIVTAFILFIGISLALLQVQFVGDLARALLASAAILSAVIGFAARTPIANFASGIMIAFAQPIRLGDYVSVDGEYGVVESMKLTFTTIHTADDRRLVIPNEVLVTKTIENYSLGGAVSAFTFELKLPVATPVDEVRRLALEEAERVAPAPAGYTHHLDVVEPLGEALHVRVSVWVTDPLWRADIAAELREAVLARLLDAGVLAGAGGRDAD
jgi:small-conductance mechanosensitive channel